MVDLLSGATSRLLVSSKRLFLVEGEEGMEGVSSLRSLEKKSLAWAFDLLFLLLPPFLLLP